MVALSNTPPAELFHYTSASGAIGIIRGSAWATMIHYFNDASEFEYALQLARRVLLEDLNLEEGAREVAVCEDYLRIVRRLSVCAFCLSERGDLLSQWRAYCPPDGGYSLAFNAESLQSVSESQGFRLVQCIYDPGMQRTLLRPALEELVTVTRTLSEFASGIDLHVRLDSHLKFPEVAAALKHPSFVEEQEWRLVSAGPKTNLSYRAHGGLVVPYAEVTVGKDKWSAVSRVIVGPHRHPEIAARAIRSISFDELGWPLRVDQSESPFRSL